MAITKVQKEGVETLINNNADNRVITGSGTANTLNGESNVVIDADGNVGIGTSSPNSFTDYTTLTINGGTGGAGIDLEKSDNNIYGRLFADSSGLQIQSAQSGDSIRFETDGSNERMRVNSDGIFMIGATSYGGGGSNPFLYVSGTGGRQVKIHNTGNATSSIQLTNSGTGQGDDNGFQIAALGSSLDGWINNVEDANIRFATNNSEKLRIQAAGGISFNGDTASANALDDYEEGSWTPTATQGVDSISGSSCRYVKIGNVCTVSANFTPAGNSNSSSVIFSGLPYTSHSSHAGAASIMHNGFDEDGSPEPTVHAYVGGSSTNFYVYYSRTAGTAWENATGEQVHSHQMIFNLTYPTA